MSLHPWEIVSIYDKRRTILLILIITKGEREFRACWRYRRYYRACYKERGLEIIIIKCLQGILLLALVLGRFVFGFLFLDPCFWAGFKRYLNILILVFRRFIAKHFILNPCFWRSRSQCFCPGHCGYWEALDGLGSQKPLRSFRLPCLLQVIAREL
jgi:hypothetical protein